MQVASTNSLPSRVLSILAFVDGTAVELCERLPALSDRPHSEVAAAVAEVLEAESARDDAADGTFHDGVAHGLIERLDLSEPHAQVVAVVREVLSDELARCGVSA